MIYNLLAEFASIVDAVQCALKIQEEFKHQISVGFSACEILADFQNGLTDRLEG